MLARKNPVSVSSDDGRDLLRDALRAELETRHRRFVLRAFGSQHPLVRLQDLRVTEAGMRLVVREARRTVGDVASAVDARRSEMKGLESLRRRVRKEVDALADAVSDLGDDVEDVRAVFTSLRGHGFDGDGEETGQEDERARTGR